jgi:hypothetical protein
MSTPDLPSANHDLDPAVARFGDVVGGRYQRVALAMVDHVHVALVDIGTAKQVKNNLGPLQGETAIAVSKMEQAC